MRRILHQKCHLSEINPQSSGASFPKKRLLVRVVSAGRKPRAADLASVRGRTQKLRYLGLEMWIAEKG